MGFRRIPQVRVGVAVGANIRRDEINDTPGEATLAGWMIADRVPARFQLQLHKQLWGNMRGK